MRVTIKKTANIIQVPDDFINLEEITQDGYFVYSVKYRADPVKVIKAKSHKVFISVSNRPQVKQSVQTFNNADSSALPGKILQKNSVSKDAIRQDTKNQYIFTLISDITKKIPNNQTINLSKGSFTTPQIVQKTISVMPALVGDLRKRNLSLPILEQNLNRNILTERNLSTGLVKLAGMQLLFDSNRDPAKAAGAKTNTIRSATDAIAGTVSKRTPSNQIPVSPEKTLVGSLLNDKKYSGQHQIDSQTYVNVISKEQNSWVEITEKLYIPIGDMDGPEFFLIFELEDITGVKIQILSRSVAHEKFVSMLQIPTEAPDLIAMTIGSLGKTVLNVRQKDKNATGVSIYRREIKKGIPTIDAEYDFIGTAPCVAGSDYIKIEDVHASINPVIYRVIPINSNGILGADFNSTVVKQQNNITTRKININRKPYFLSLSHEIRNQSIIIEIKDYPIGPCALILKKKNKSIKEQTYSQVGNVAVINEESNATITFEDKDVLDGKIYEYIVVLVYPGGTQEISATNLLLEFNPVISNIMNLNVTEPETVQNGSNIDIVFTISKNIIQNDTDRIKTFLAEQGLTTEFQDQLLANRDKFQDLFAVQVSRTNLSTGELENFGIIDSQNFSDLKYGSINSAKPLQAGFDYKYNIVAYARNIESISPTLIKTIDYRTNVSYSFKPAEWRHPLTLNNGTIVTDSSLKRNHSKSMFTFGTVVDSQIVNVSLGNVLPSLTEGKATMFGRDRIFAQWKVQGNVNKIDHFIVILDILGVRTVVGKCHNITNSNYFQFVDELTNNESGELSYIIIPVYFDYSRGPELKTNSVIV